MIDPRPDGTIWIDLEDGTPPIVVRRPKYGEFKRFQLALMNVREITRAPQEAFEAIPDDKDVSDDEKPTVDAQRKAAGEAAEKAAEDALAGWWREVVGILGDRPLPDSIDDWPIDLIMDGAAIAGVSVHWRTVPLDRGAMGQPTPSMT
jgi:nucleotide-binding universal stress UspA family protein